MTVRFTLGPALRQGLPLAACLLFSAQAAAQEGPLEIIEQSEPRAKLRYRFEFVDQEGFNEDAKASTLSARVGLETGPYRGFSTLVEFEAVTRLGPEDFNSTVNGRTAFPVVADPSTLELNRAQLRYRGLKGVDLIGGRQRIVLDNARFFGDVAFRQNHQSFDAARVDIAPLAWLAGRYIFVGNANRVVGDDSPAGNFGGESHAAQLGVTPVEGVALTAYGYLLDIEERPGLSSQTYGARLTAKRELGGFALAAEAEYANQQDYTVNPGDFSLDYWLASLSVGYGPVTLTPRYERLDGDGAAGFQTPYATLHKFQGWADVFLTTPAVGIEDVSVQVAAALGSAGPFANIKGLVRWHDFSAALGGASLGSEWDGRLTATLGEGFALAVIFAAYDGADFAADRTKIWFELGYAF